MKKLISYFMLALVAVVFTECSKTPPEPTILKVTVVDKGTSQPIQGARVTIDGGKSDLTNSSGVIQFEKIVAKTYVISVEKSGYLTEPGSVEVLAEQTTATTISLRATSVPTITTSLVTGITLASATSGGNVTSAGGVEVTMKGICWGTNPFPTTANSKTENGSGTGIFTSEMTGLTDNTKYYVRAYAINSIGIGYGTEVNFTTSQNVAPSATFDVKTMGSIYTNQDVELLISNIIDEDKPTLKFYWRWNTGESFDGPFSTTTKLYKYTTEGTKSISLKVVDNKGQEYITPAQTVTILKPLAPKVTIGTSSFLSGTHSIAYVEGAITDLGTGSTSVTEYGHCWSTSTTPTISDAHTTFTNATKTLAYTSQLTGLSAKTTYYVRAYAKNATGISYSEGSSANFITDIPAPPLDVLLYKVLDKTTVSATVKAVMNNLPIGTTSTIEYGFCWSINQKPDYSLPAANKIVKTGNISIGTEFQENISGITSGTYYVRAYVKTSSTIVYSNQIDFTL